MIYVKMNSHWGPMVAGICDSGALSGLWFVGQKHFPNVAAARDAMNFSHVRSTWSLSSETLESIAETLRNLETQLIAYEKGALTEFDLPLEPQGTDFQKLVWRLLCDIPYGQMTTYGDISRKVAAEMGRDTMSAQAVGGAIGRNPVSIIVPCHRVVGTSGSLTGYAGGIDKKSALLIHEGAL